MEVSVIKHGYKIVFEGKGKTAKAYLKIKKSKTEWFLNMIKEMKDLGFVFTHIEPKTGAIVFKKVPENDKQSE